MKWTLILVKKKRLKHIRNCLERANGPMPSAEPFIEDKSKVPPEVAKERDRIYREELELY